LGMPKASPASSTTYQFTSSETIFLFHHILCSLLGASVCFYFCFGLNKVGSHHPYIGDITLRFFIWNTCVLNCALMFMAKAYCFVRLLFGWNWKMMHMV
jgi:hypothetical protein